MNSRELTSKVIALPQVDSLILKAIADLCQDGGQTDEAEIQPVRVELEFAIRMTIHVTSLDGSMADMGKTDWQDRLRSQNRAWLTQCSLEAAVRKAGQRLTRNHGGIVKIKQVAASDVVKRAVLEVCLRARMLKDGLDPLLLDS